MMETRLQSNEVRIPKNDRQTTSPKSAFKSSFARSLSFSKPLDLQNGFRSPVTPPSPATCEKDDDFEEFMRHSPLKKALQAKQQHFTTPTKGRTLPTNASLQVINSNIL